MISFLKTLMIYHLIFLLTSLSVTRKSCSMLLSNIYEHARPSCKLILPLCTFAFHSFLSLEPIPVGIDRQLGEFSLVSLCGSCEFYQQQERVRTSPQKSFPPPHLRNCMPPKNLNAQLKKTKNLTISWRLCPITNCAPRLLLQLVRRRSVSP